jgi:hypothetical protein
MGFRPFSSGVWEQRRAVVQRNGGFPSLIDAFSTNRAWMEQRLMGFCAFFRPEDI